MAKIDKRIIVLLWLLFFWLLASNGYGAQLNIRPDADLGTPQWETVVPAGTHYTTIDEETASDADYIATKTLNKSDWFSLQDASGTIPSGSTIDSVKIRDRIKGELDDDFTNQTHYIYYKIGNDSSGWAPPISATWADQTSNNLTAPGGRSWTRNNLDSLVIHLKKDMAGVPANTYYTYSSQLYVAIYYTAPSGVKYKGHTIVKQEEDTKGIAIGGVVQ